MADGDGGTAVAGLLAQQALWRQAGAQQHGPAMLDRHQERAAVDRVLDFAREGFSGALVLRGEPGTGKTTLLEYAIDSAPDLRVSSVVGVESEISMAFAALHQLLIPFMPLLPALPAPQRDAMKIAFALEAGPPPDLFLVGLAALTLVSGAAEEQPLLCVIDDGHWVDPESAQVLGFVARRLYGKCVGLAGERLWFAEGYSGGSLSDQLRGGGLKPSPKDGSEGSQPSSHTRRDRRSLSNR